MAELSAFRGVDARELLVWAFAQLAENAGGQGLQVASGGGFCRLNKILGLKEAAKVVAFVDNKLEPVERALVRFCFARGSESAESKYYNQLHNFVWNCDHVQMLLEGRRQAVRDGLSFIRFLVPHEARHRIFNPGKHLCDGARLSGHLGVDPRAYSRNYREAWEGMVDVLMEVGSVAFGGIEEWLDDVLSARLAVIEDQQMTAEIGRLMRRAG